MSVFHRVDNIEDLPGPKFFSLAVRLTAYTGVLQARAEALRQEEEDSGTTSYSTAQTSNVSSSQSVAPRNSRVIPENDPEMLNLIHTQSGKGAKLFKVVKGSPKEDADQD